ncbi:MAG: hypothetical protein Q8907_14075 [Bacteroidota bacterium]|nr:hypothetical protein [Bacteroidota bacterium]MDP4275398.1 hypothetical protein [Bacteroidota bacterium]
MKTLKVSIILLSIIPFTLKAQGIVYLYAGIIPNSKTAVKQGISDNVVPGLTEV